MVVLQMAEGPGHFRVTSRVGSRVPLNWTASGRLLVGHLPDDERIAFFHALCETVADWRAPKRVPTCSRKTAREALERGCRSRSANRMRRLRVWPRRTRSGRRLRVHHFDRDAGSQGASEY